MRLLRDEATLRYAFGKLGKEGIERLANGAPSADDLPRDVIERAWRNFTAGYRRPERIHTKAASELSAAIKDGLLPRWALALYSPEELAALQR